MFSWSWLSHVLRLNATPQKMTTHASWFNPMIGVPLTLNQPIFRTRLEINARRGVCFQPPVLTVNFFKPDGFHYFSKLIIQLTVRLTLFIHFHPCLLRFKTPPQKMVIQTVGFEPVIGIVRTLYYQPVIWINFFTKNGFCERLTTHVDTLDNDCFDGTAGESTNFVSNLPACIYCKPQTMVAVCLKYAGI